MRYLTDDYGRSVISVGAPGSIERAKAQYPRLIDRINSLYWQAEGCPGRGVDEALDMIRADGIKNGLETNSILLSTMYKEQCGKWSVTDLIIAAA